MLGSAFGGLVAAGCLTLDGRHGISGWRWLFIVEGAATVGCGLISAAIMPEYPHNARMLTDAERDLAVWRLESEAGAGEAHEDTTAMGGFRLALLDPKIWAMVLCNHLSQAMGSTVNFFPSIVETLGFTQMKSLLLTAPPYLFAAILFYGLSWYSDVSASPEKSNMHLPPTHRCCTANKRCVVTAAQDHHLPHHRGQPGLLATRVHHPAGDGADGRPLLLHDAHAVHRR